jgi:hypothetical protein
MIPRSFNQGGLHLWLAAYNGVGIRSALLLADVGMVKSYRFRKI